MKEFKTVAELEASKQTVSDLMLYCRENNLYYIVQDAGYTPTGDDVTFTNGRVGKAAFIADAKYIRTTSGNVQDELDSIVAGGLPSQSGNQFKFLSTDGTSAQWSNGQIEVATFAELEALSPEAEGLVFICQERGNAKYILQGISYSALPGDITFANGRVAELQVEGKALSGWFESLSDAVNRARSILVTKDYTVSNVLIINCTNEPFEIDLGGHTLTSDNTSVFTAFGSLLNETTVSSHTANTIEISAASDLANYIADSINDRPIIKIVSDDAIDVNENLDERRGEHVRVKSISGGTLTLESNLYFTYTTAPRVAVLVSEKFTLKNGVLDVSDLGAVRGTQVFLTKLNSPLIEDIEIKKGNDAGIVLRSCYEAKVVRPSIHNLTDNAGGGFFGYGIDDNSSHATLVTDGDFSNTRHAYTTNTGESTAGGDMAAFGATMYSKVKDCTCTGNSDDAFDTHPNAYFISFESIKGYRNSKGLIKDRAKFTTVKNPESYGDTFGVRTTGNCDNLKVINPVIENTTIPLFFDNITKGSVTLDGGVMSLTDGNEVCRLTNIDLKGSANFKYSGSTNFSKMFRLSSSTVNIENFFADTTESTATSFRLFEIASGGDNEIRVNEMRVKSSGSPSSLNMVNDATGTGTNKAIIDNLLLDSFYTLSGNTLTSDSYSIARWPQGDSSTLYASITAGGQAIPELSYNGSPKISLITTAPNSTVTLTALPDGIFTGQVITVTLSKNSNSFLTIAHGASGNTDLIGAANVTLGKGESMSLFWNGGAWEEFRQTN